MHVIVGLASSRGLTLAPLRKFCATPVVPVVPLARPTEPAMEECCGNDCRNCVWTVYWEKLQAWEASQPPASESSSNQVLGERDTMAPLSDDSRTSQVVASEVLSMPDSVSPLPAVVALSRPD